MNKNFKIIKAVIFDIDGVILDSFEASLKFHHDLITKAGYKPVSRKEYRKLFHRPMLDNIKTITKSNNQKEIEKIYQMGVKREVKYPNELLAFPKKMNETIKLLSKDYLLGIVTSRVKNGVFEAREMKEIKKYFNEVVSFEDTTKHKPDPEPLLLIAQKLNLKPEEIVYIGDVETDFQAAKSAGMKFILFSKRNIKGVNLSTSNFSKLPNLIMNLDK